MHFDTRYNVEEATDKVDGDVADEAKDVDPEF